VAGVTVQSCAHYYVDWVRGLWTEGGMRVRFTMDGVRGEGVSAGCSSP
jgi:hypothetical protein